MIQLLEKQVNVGKRQISDFLCDLLEPSRSLWSKRILEKKQPFQTEFHLFFSCQLLRFGADLRPDEFPNLSTLS